MNIYIANDYYMLRTPLLPSEKYFEMCNASSEMEIKTYLKTICEDEKVQEALIIASQSLYEEIERINIFGESKEANKLLLSLIKYFIRFTTRTTPFGLFSGISIGKFGMKTNVLINSEKTYVKRARVDMGWLYEVIKEIEADANTKNYLRFRFNDFTYLKGNRLEKGSNTCLQKNSDEEKEHIVASSIRYTKQVENVETFCKESRCAMNIVAELIRINPGVSIQRITKFVNQLIDNEYLLSELRPSLINTDSLDYVINVLADIKDIPNIREIYVKLCKVQTEILEYNKTEIGKGVDTYIEICRLMKDIHASKNFLQVDMKSDLKNNVLDYQLKKELEEFVNAMHKISPRRRMSRGMSSYIKKFAEKYGYECKVPVLELVDEDQGIGLPQKYKNNFEKENYTRSKEIRLKKLKERKIQLALLQNKKSIDFTDEDISFIAGDETENISYSISDFELYLFVHPGYIDENNKKYDFTIAPMIGSDMAGKTFGRFQNLLSDDEKKILDDTSRKQKLVMGEYIIAEIYEMPLENGRLGNVSSVGSNCDYQVALSTNTASGLIPISIRDLYIGLDRNNFFYIMSKTQNKRVKIVSTSMLNYLLGNPVASFLKEISGMCSNYVIQGIADLVQSDYEYCPRITYKNIIISPQKWLISKENLKIQTNKMDEFIEKFENHVKEWKISRFVYFTQNDNRLLIDLENLIHIQELFSNLKKNNVIELQEAENVYEYYPCVNNDQKHYASEIVVPFIKTLSSKYDYNAYDLFDTKSDVSANCMTNYKHKKLLPGKGEWIFYKIYGVGKRQKEFMQTIFEVLENYVSKREIKKYFFIRYSDPEFHFRLRVQFLGEQGEVMEELNNMFYDLEEKKIISRIVVDTYQREIERYGGELTITCAEEFFSRESYAIMRQYEKILTIPEVELDCLGISYIINVLRIFGLNTQEQQQYLEMIGDKGVYKELIHLNRKKYMYAADYSNNWSEIKSIIECKEIYQILDDTADILKQYAETVANADKKGLLTNTIQGIVSSLIHMFCNRVSGNEWEKKIYSLARCGIRALNGYKKYN